MKNLEYADYADTEYEADYEAECDADICKISLVKLFDFVT